MADLKTGPAELSALALHHLQNVINSQFARVVSPVLLTAVLALTAIHPLLYGSLPRTDDGLQHLYRLVGLDIAIHHWDLWPRYVPTLFYGYGIPIFNFYPPVSLYPLELFHLVGFTFPVSLRMGFIFYLLVGGLGAYLLGKAWGGAVAGVGTTVAYVYAPYTLLNMLWRGSLAELAGLSLLPWVMLAFKRLAERGRQQDFILAVLGLSLLILTHNITALLGLFVLAPYCLFLWWTGSRPPRIFIHLALAGLLAAGLTTFYWLPALAELKMVHIERTRIGVQNPPDAPDFYIQFQTLDQTLALPETADLTWLNRSVKRTVAWPSLALAVIGGTLAVVSHAATPEDRSSRALVFTALAIICLLIAMTTVESAWVWALIRPLQFVQFPWRSLGPVSLLVALLAGLGLANVQQRISSLPGQVAWVVSAVVVTVVYAMPWLYVLYIPDPPSASIVDAQDYERATGQVGGTARGEYVPRWVITPPDANRLKGLYLQSDVIPRLQPNPDILASEMVWEPTAARLNLKALHDTNIVLDWTYFPGWWATLDGERTGIAANQPDGLLRIAVPEGEHVLAVGFSPTPLRLGALIASGGFLIVIVVLSTLVPRLWTIDAAWPADNKLEVDWRVPSVVMGAVVLVFGVKAVYLDNYPNPFIHARFEEGTQAGLEFPVQATFGGQITLLGYNLDRKQASPGQTLDLDLFWQPIQGKISDDYTTVLYLRDAAGNIIAEANSPNPGGTMTSSWLQGFYVLDPHQIKIPPAIPPGEYGLYAGMYSYKEQKSLDIVDGAGIPAGILIPLTEITVTRPVSPASLDELKAAPDTQILNLKISPRFTLAASNRLPAQGGTGQPLPVITYWKVSSQPDQQYQYRIIWMDSDEHIAASTPPLQIALNYPTDQWKEGDLWRSLNIIYVPGKLNTGTYQVAAQLIDASGQPMGDFGWLGEMAVTTPQRSYTPPRSEVTTSAYWRVGIWLTGYSIVDTTVRQGDGVQLTLIWQPRTDITRNLTVFVHLLDEKGNIVVQQDSIPGSGSRPTPGWAPGEYISDSYALYLDPARVPPGRYMIRIGWYDAVTGERFLLSDDTEFWLMPQLIRVQRGP